MKTFVVLCALVCSALAAPAQLDQDNPNWQNREKKSPVTGPHLGTHQVLVPIHHQPQFHHEHLGLKKPLIQHGHHGVHHSLGHGVVHHGHGFRNEEQEEKDAATVTEVTELKSAEDINESLESGLESNIKMARTAVDNMKRDLAEMESTANARKQWKHSDSKSDSILHDNIEVAKEALEKVQTSFDNLESIQNKKMSGKDAESIQDAELEKMTEEERMAKWKSAIETIQKNVEIANNIKQSLTSGKAEEQDKMLPSHETRSSVTKPIIVEAHKKPGMDKKIETEMETSASTKVEMRDHVERQEGNMEKEKSSWHHKNEMKSASSNMEIHDELPLEKSALNKQSHINHEASNTSMKSSEKEVLSNNGQKRIDSSEVTAFKVATSDTPHEKEHKQMHHERHNEPSQMHGIQKAREDGAIEAIAKSAHQDSQSHQMKGADGTILNTKATRKFGSEEVEHHGANAHTENKFDQHEKQLRAHSTGMSVGVDTTTLMKERASDAKSSLKQSEMEPQASEIQSQVLFEKDNMDEKLKHDSMKSAKSATTAMQPSMHSSMRATENIQMVKDSKHEEARSFGPASYGPSVAVSAPSYGPSYGPSVAASALAPVSYGANLAAPIHSYSAPASYGSGLVGASGSGVSLNLGGSGPSGAVGVFPNARLGGCAVPLLLSCSPSVVSGNLAKVHPSYGPSASSYGAVSGTGSYKANEQLSSHTKRDVKISKFPAKKARRAFFPILDKKF